jgi:hypothetical protein
MDLGYGYEQHWAPRRPPRPSQGLDWPLPNAEPSDDGIESRRSWNSTTSSMETLTSATEVTVQSPLWDPSKAAQNATRLGDSVPDTPGLKGYAIESALRRHFVTWIDYFLALFFFVFTVIFAWSATGGTNADTRFFFKDPGITILVLQISSTVTASLLTETLIASCEMVSPRKLSL